MLTPRTLLAALVWLACSPALADCDDTRNSCTTTCDANATTGFIAGLAGALGRNDALYNQGQGKMQASQACYARCQNQYNSCSAQQAQLREQEAARRQAQQQQEEARRQAQLAREKLKQRVNRVFHPPLLPPPRMKNATGVLTQAAAYTSAGKPEQARMLYELVETSGPSPAQRKQARQQLDKMEQAKLSERNIAGVGDLGLLATDVYAVLDNALELTPERLPPPSFKTHQLVLTSGGTIENDMTDTYRWQSGYLVNERIGIARFLEKPEKEQTHIQMRRVYALNGLILVALKAEAGYSIALASLGGFSGKLFPPRAGGSFSWRERRNQSGKPDAGSLHQCNWVDQANPLDFGLQRDDKAWRLRCRDNTLDANGNAVGNGRTDDFIYISRLGVFFALSSGSKDFRLQID